MELTNAYLEFFASAILLILSASTLDHKKKGFTYIRPFTLMIFAAVFTDAWSWVFVGRKTAFPIVELIWVVDYIVMMSAVGAFHRYVLSGLKEETGRTGKWWDNIPYVFLAILALIWITSPFTKHFFYFDGNAMPHYGRFYWFSQLGAGIVIFADMIYLFVNRHKLPLKTLIAYFSFVILPVLALPIEALTGSAAITYLAMTASVVICHTFLEYDVDRVIKEQEEEILDNKSKLMLSQIQPHFLFNALNTISYLCDEDAGEAKKAIIHFAKYLRMNLDAINKQELIDFEEELNHTKTYLWLEELRYEELLKTVCVVNTSDFKIPALTLQPIVENAVKHGFKNRKEGIRISVIADEFDDYFQVMVVDDGVGFTPSNYKDDGGNHVGIRSVENRLRLMCNGRMEIDSEIGKGTTVKIIIPKEQENS